MWMDDPHSLDASMGVPFACVSNELRGLVSVLLLEQNRIGYLHIDRMECWTWKLYILHIVVSEFNRYINQLNEYA
jgi:hypothetical protein